MKKLLAFWHDLKESHKWWPVGSNRITSQVSGAEMTAVYQRCEGCGATEVAQLAGHWELKELQERAMEQWQR